METSTLLSRGFSVDDDNYFYWALVCNLWSLHSSFRVLTTVTCCRLASQTICFSIFSPYKALQHVLLLVLDVVSTSRRSWGNFIGCQCNGVLNSSWQFWYTRPVSTRWPAYLFTAGRRRLRSSNVATCEVPRTRTSLGDHSFTVAGPRLWNNLPLHLCGYVILNILSWSSASYLRRTCFTEDSGA